MENIFNLIWQNYFKVCEVDAFMKKDIQVEPHIDKIVMPDNLKVGLMIAEQRKNVQVVVVMKNSML